MQPCKYFIAGFCHFDEKCKFILSPIYEAKSSMLELDEKYEYVHLHLKWIKFKQKYYNKEQNKIKME